MKTMWKIVAVAMVIMAVAVPMVMYAPLIAASTNNDSDGGNVTLESLKSNLNPEMPAVWRYLLKHAEPVVIEGTLSAHAGRLLIIDEDQQQQVSVVVPRGWLVDGNTVRLAKIFQEGMIKIGDHLTITALQASYKNENGVTIYLIFGYEIYNASNDKEFKALLPFNIEVP